MKKYIQISFGFLLLVSLTSTTYSRETDPKYEYAWLAGRWEGEAFGGTTETIWSPPSEDGTMVGLFRLFTADGSIGVYQFILLDKTGMRIKHFSSDLVGWESKDKFVTFEMVDFDKNRIEMESLVYERKSKNEIVARLEVSRNGEVTTEVLTKRRVK
ncbi:MAG: DUF6265 family protein [Cyclobacteriaceae bacterium]